jgi:hypothetical protein
MAITTQPAPRQPTQWQAPPQPIPSTARGVPQESPPPAPKFVLPRPEALGVSADLRVAQLPAVALAPQVDWNQIQARMERLGVLSYHKVRMPTGAVHVMLTLPSADPTRGRPVEAQGATEAVAILAALQQAEARR